MTQDRKRGGAVKKAPPGYYTAKQARERLGLNESTFGYYVRTGKITKHVPPLKKEGFYEKREIDQMATEIDLYFHTHSGKQPDFHLRPARPEDAQGIYDVLDSFGWPTAPIELRHAWYQVNPFIDYVVIAGGQVKGYITAVPYKAAAMEGIMSGRKRAWDMRPTDILPYRAGGVYDLYVGIAARQDDPRHTTYASRLIAGFAAFLGDLAEQGIRVRRMYAVSAEPDGQKLSRDIGFLPLPAQQGDLFPRFVLDLETSESRFATKYRQTLTHLEKDI